MGIGLKDIIKDDKDALVRNKQKRTLKRLLITVAILAIMIVVVIVLLVLNGSKTRRLDHIANVRIDMVNISKIAKARGDEYIANNYSGNLIGTSLDNYPYPINENGSVVEYRYGYYALTKEELAQLTSALNLPDETYIVNYLTGDVVNVNGIVAKDGKIYHSLEDIIAIADDTKLPDITYISTAEQMKLIEKKPSGTYRLAKNIDMATYASGEGWTPVSNFTGTFDGRGYTITNLTVNRPTTRSCGLFAEIKSNAEVKNLNLEQVNVSGGEYTGVLAGICSGNVSNITIKGGQVNSAQTYIGALVGAFDQGTIDGCYVEDVIINGNNSVGGLIGTMYNGTVYRSGAKVKITAVESVGGLIGSIVANSNTTVNQAFANADIIGQKNVGGFIGTLQITSRSTLTLKDSYSEGIIDNGGEGKGGSIGYLYAANSPEIYIQSLYTATVVPTDATARGGFVGRTNIQTGTNVITEPKSYYEVERYLDPNLTDVGVKTGYSVDFNAKSPAEMKVSLNFADWNFRDVWTIDEGVTRPYLRWEK